MELAKAYVQIIPSADGITGGIEKAISGEVNEAGEKSGRSFSSKFIGTASAAITAGAAAVGAAATSVWAVASKTAEAGDQIDKASQKVGVSAEQYQAMSFAAEHCGFSVDAFTLAARNLENSDFDGTVWDATNAIMALEDPTERASLATELFGARTAQQMMAMLNADDSLTDYMANLESLGGIMSQEAVSASAVFEDSLADLQHAFNGVKTQMTADFLPAMSTVMQGLTDMIAGKEGGLEKVREGIKQFMDNLADMIPDLIDVAGDLISAFIDVIIDNLPQIIEMGVTIIAKLIVGILKAIPQLVEKTPQIIQAFVSAIMSAMGQVVQVGQQIVNGVWQGISNARAQFTANVKNFFSSIVNSVKSALGIHSPSRVFASEIGKWIPAGIAEGIADNGSVVDDALNDVMSGSRLSATANISAVSTGVTGQMASAQMPYNGNTVVNVEINYNGTGNEDIDAKRMGRLFGVEVGKQMRGRGLVTV